MSLNLYRVHFKSMELVCNAKSLVVNPGDRRFIYNVKSENIAGAYLDALSMVRKQTREMVSLHSCVLVKENVDSVDTVIYNHAFTATKNSKKYGFRKGDVLPCRYFDESKFLLVDVHGERKGIWENDLKNRGTIQECDSKNIEIVEYQ